FRDDAAVPFAVEDVANVGEVLLKKFVMRPDVADARPAAEFAAAEDCSVLARTAVIPASRPANLPSELHERDVERRLHESPFALKKNGARDANVFGVAVVRCARNRLLLAGERAREILREHFHHDRLHHRAAVDLDVSAERVDEIPAGDPRDRAVNGVLRDAVAAVLAERLSVRHRARELPRRVSVEGGHRPPELYPPLPPPS